MTKYNGVGAIVRKCRWGCVIALLFAQPGCCRREAVGLDGAGRACCAPVTATQEVALNSSTLSR